jgi:hypothetical protein
VFRIDNTITTTRTKSRGNKGSGQMPRMPHDAKDWLPDLIKAMSVR